MKVEVPKGKYILGVSGGVDSMVLLDLLARKPGIKLVVGHFNHGIRPDAAKDEQLAAKRAKQLKLAYEAGYGNLGKGASEESARNARYQFLSGLKQKHRADAIITAHHQDDMLETAFLNILRGTGRRGLSAISDNTNILRPLLHVSKRHILKYAEQNQLEWVEDLTNEDTAYLRNFIRLRLMPKLGARDREILISKLDKVAKTNKTIAGQIATLSQLISINNEIDRAAFAAMPANLSSEIVTQLLRDAGMRDYDKKIINKTDVALRTAKAGTVHPVKRGLRLEIDKKTARFTNTLQ